MATAIRPSTAQGSRDAADGLWWMARKASRRGPEEPRKPMMTMVVTAEVSRVRASRAPAFQLSVDGVVLRGGVMDGAVSFEVWERGEDGMFSPT
ncbi:MAG: hypothetical protein AUG49_00870 [Catenulispora sp. 13_1_20CM_3_70_7]|nr:MAG: hypothetical protein AUG49_00870 [Catenulispora sp. 13_1_20CM_3_70_7]